MTQLRAVGSESWILIGLGGGVNIVGVVDVERFYDARTNKTSEWIEIEKACSYATQVAHLPNGSSAIVSTMIPWGASPDTDVTVRLQTSAVQTFVLFQEMPKAMRAMLEAKIREAAMMAKRLSAASAGLISG